MDTTLEKKRKSRSEAFRLFGIGAAKCRACSVEIARSLTPLTSFLDRERNVSQLAERGRRLAYDKFDRQFGDAFDSLSVESGHQLVGGAFAD